MQPANAPRPYQSLVNRQRVLDTFKTVSELWAPSGQEKVVADKVVDRFTSIGLPGATVSVDDTAPQTHGDTGNVIMDIPATPDAPSEAPSIGLFFHMDRVPARAPGVADDEPVHLVMDQDGTLHSQDYRTNIAADDRAGYAEIAEALSIIHENHLPHGHIRVIGFTNEETDSSGAAQLDPKYVKDLNFAFEFDGDDVPQIMRGGASITSWQADILGKAAHSGMNPQDGISAIQGANAAINHMGKLGLVQPGQTLNVAYMAAGEQDPSGFPILNQIPDHARVAGEFRGATPDDESKLRRTVTEAFAQAEQEVGVQVKLQMDSEAGFVIPDGSPVLNYAVAGMRLAGVEPHKDFVMGGSDANPLNTDKGLPTVVLGNGVQQMHTVHEHINWNDLCQGAEVVVGLTQQALSPVPSPPER